MPNIFKLKNQKNTKHTEHTEESDNNTKGLSWPKKIGIFFLIIYGIFYFVSDHQLNIIANKTQEILIATNTDLTGQKITVDHIKTSMYGDGNNIFKLTINNPTGFTSPFAISADNIRTNTSYSMDPNYPYIVVTSMIFKKVYIYYEVNANKENNLYKILDTIINNTKPGPEFLPTDILRSGVTATTNLKYTGTKFFLGNVFLEKPTVYVFRNNTLVKTIELNNIVLNYNTVKQPMQYADAVLAGSLQLIEKLDAAVGK